VPNVSVQNSGLKISQSGKMVSDKMSSSILTPDDFAHSNVDSKLLFMFDKLLFHTR